MANLRSVNTHFWADNYVSDLDPIEKLLFLYLITNPLTTLAGCYEVSERRIAFDTGIDKDMVIKILERFQANGKLIYQNGWIVLTNFLSNQSLNENMRKNVVSVLAEAPTWVSDVVATIIESSQTLSKGFESFEILRKDEVEVEREYKSETEIEREEEIVTTEAATHRNPKPSNKPILIQEANGSEMGFPVADLFMAFPDLILTPSHLGLLISNVTDTPLNRKAWKSTLDIYIGNRDDSTKSYNPNRIGTVIKVFQKEQADLEKAKNGNNTNGRTKQHPNAKALDEWAEYARTGEISS